MPSCRNPGRNTSLSSGAVISLRVQWVQIVGFQGPKTNQGMDLGTYNLTTWVLGPSG